MARSKKSGIIAILLKSLEKIGNEPEQQSCSRKVKFTREGEKNDSDGIRFILDRVS